jgi:hypothetical protein
VLPMLESTYDTQHLLVVSWIIGLSQYELPRPKSHRVLLRVLRACALKLG